jgi:outer membrane lipoprotein-sorting protein
MNLAKKKWWSYLVVLILLFGTFYIHPQVTGEKVLDDFIKATSGKAAYKKIRNEVRKSTLELADMGLTIKSTVYKTIPNLYYSVIEVNNVKAESGFDGEVVWEISSSTGARILEGEEKWDRINFNLFYFAHRWRDNITEVRLDGEETFEGQPCYVVTLVPKQGCSITFYSSKKSKLIIRTKYTQNSIAGRLPVDIYNLEYGKINGILVAVKYKMKIADKIFTGTIDSVKFNVKIPKKHFKLPPVIRTLLKNNKTESNQ